MAENRKKPAAFAGNYRIHIGLPATDVQESRRFYEALFGVSPVKEKEDYVKFEPDDPSVNLSLIQVQQCLPLNAEAHFGIQLQSLDALEIVQRRLSAAGVATVREQSVECCYAVQEKIWATDPDGHPWEMFLVLDPDAPSRRGSAEASLAQGAVPSEDGASACCEPTCCSPAETATPTELVK